MKVKKIISFIVISVIFLSSAGRILAQDISCISCHLTEPKNKTFHKINGQSEYAVGIMDKGQIANNSFNYGEIANFLATGMKNGGHWPRSADFERQYFFGLGLLVAINEHNVISTATQMTSTIQDWLPPDNSLGLYYSGDKTASDGTPFQATSDLEDTWLYGYNNGDLWVDDPTTRYWPGHYRIDTQHPDFPNTLVEHEGRFTSDRDIYAVYNDHYNTKGEVGITVEQTGYSYGRPYAEDFLFFELKIHNTSAVNLDSVYIGLYSRMRPDFDNKDYVHFEDSDNDGKKDLIITYDVNNYANQTSWSKSSYKDPMGMVGLRIYDTPMNMGVTDFHHFAKEYSPLSDEELWALMTSKKDNSSLEYSLDCYFHGDNQKIDDTSEEHRGDYYPESLNEDVTPPFSQMEEGAGVNTIISVGPFTLSADSMVVLSFGLIMGNSGKVFNEPDFSDLNKNVQSANEMYKNYFLGYSAPDAPKVSGVSGDESATLYWSADPSEFSKDDATGLIDFEGYKIFRSDDQGLSWGNPITDANGEIIGYAPIAIYDIVDGVNGIDPAYPQNLGDDSGLAHSFKDKGLMNGHNYWYSVTSYDKGNQDPNNLLQSFTNPIGSDTLESHLVSVIPGVAATTLIEASVPDDALTAVGGVADGTVKIRLLDPDLITGDDYELSFTTNIIDANDTRVLILVNTSTSDTLLVNQLLSDESGDNIPVTEGFRLYVKDIDDGTGFSNTIHYEFTTTAQSYSTSSSLGENALSELRVVPDPYIVSNSVETGEFGKRLKFNHLPDKCTIKIFTLTGDYIADIEHDAPTGYEFWNMRTKNDQYLAAGVYLYYATTPDGDIKKGRFLVIR